ncbi:D-2-hydroxyacid dehydrogenase [Arthrobacter sp. ERGS1:01]|uniref:D-2-hydroxyacid dehydrogenase n=1 Tax=Arthrobacter sp. ERGS1:01 TaxID=1704044 RepID=UPI0006B69A62|nr:D-2-hydroxyacid dehydrogenase [Arthrobacter sp. ERGS1:01]
MFTGTARINYLSTLNFDDDFLERIGSAADGVEVRQITASSAEEIDAATWAQVDVLHTSSAICDPATAPRLRWIQLDTSGVDHLRGTPAWNSVVDITTIGGISPVPLAEYVIWSILGTAHRLPALLDVRQSRQWPSPDERWERMLPAPVRGSTVGIVGYGRIGREIGRLAQALGMRVLGLSRTAGTRTADVGDYFDAAQDQSGSGQATAVELLGPDRLHELMSRSDYLVVVVPLTEATRNMIDGPAFAHLKDQAVVINVARGGIVDEQALREGLHEGRIRAAVLDVFDAEPLPPEDSWWDEANVFTTPHVSGLAPEYSSQVLDIVGENLRRFAEGRALMNLVDREQGY